ncbi:MAG: hypothetical protein K2N46_15230 [Lachnospiraceae bacterium]|nr:hypothetical protein [Lachnospiraceae bacterium]
MKKKKLISISIIVVLIICIILIGKSLIGSHPFKNLTVEEIAGATVELYPPDTKAELNSQEIEDLVGILHEVVIYKEDNSYTEYNGQGVVFEITKTDGTITRINAYNPFIIIDGVGYKTKYEPCEQLSRLGNNIR